MAGSAAEITPEMGSEHLRARRGLRQGSSPSWLSPRRPFLFPLPCPAIGRVIAGCFLVDFLVARRAELSLERTRPGALSLSYRSAFKRAWEASTRHGDPRPPERPAHTFRATTLGSGRDIDGELIGRHRGIHVLPPLTVRAAGPLGLGSIDHSLGTSQDVIVLPDLPRARRLAAARRRGRSSDEAGSGPPRSRNRVRDDP